MGHPIDDTFSPRANEGLLRDKLASFAPKGEAPSEPPGQHDKLIADMRAAWDGSRSAVAAGALPSGFRMGLSEGAKVIEQLQRERDNLALLLREASDVIREFESAPPPPEPEQSEIERLREKIAELELDAANEAEAHEASESRKAAENAQLAAKLDEWRAWYERRKTMLTLKCVSCGYESKDIRFASASPMDTTPPPEPVVRWCLKDPHGGLRLGSMPSEREEAAQWLDGGDRTEGWTVVRVEITERPE